MNLMSRKIVACFFAVMVGINLMPAALGAVDLCVSQSCFHCDKMAIDLNEPTPIFGTTGHMCDSFPENNPCHLNKNTKPNEQAFIVSSVKEDRQETDGLLIFSISESSFLKNIRGNETINHFRTTTNSVPIYLQNLSLLC